MSARGAELQNQIRSLLQRIGAVFFRVDIYCCPRCRTPFNAAAKGFPDFIVFLKDRAIALEAKMGKAVQSPEQKAWQLVLEASGIRYYVVHSVEEAAKIVR